jgi:hypothetical protein
VSDYLLDGVDGQDLDAVMAHEIGHGREHHLLIRVGLFGVAIFLGLLPGGGVVGGLLFLYLAFGLGIRLEKRADDYAVRTVGRDSTVRALRHIAELNDTPLRTGRLWNSLTDHPGIAQRVQRIGGQIEPPDATKTKLGRQLPVAWRVVLPLAWVIARVVGLAVAGGDAPNSYPPAVTAAMVISFVAVFVVPIAAGLGQWWAPLAGVIGAACALVPSYWDARQPGQHGPFSLAIFSALLVLSLTAARDRRLRGRTAESNPDELIPQSPPRWPSTR